MQEKRPMHSLVGEALKKVMLPGYPPKNMRLEGKNLFSSFLHFCCAKLKFSAQSDTSFFKVGSQCKAGYI